MAFELIFGKSAQPGSWQVAERLLSIDSPDAVEKFLKNIRAEAYSKVVSKADQQKIRELERERDSALADKDLDRCFKKCMEIAELSKTFTKDNIAKAINSFVHKGPIINAADVDFILLYLLNCYYYYASENVAPLDRSQFVRTAFLCTRIPGMADLNLRSKIEAFLSIKDATSTQERMSNIASVVVTLTFFQSIDRQINPALLEQFVENIETNPTLVRLFESPFDFASMKLFERHFITSFMQTLVLICSLLGSEKAATSLRKKKWFAKFVTNIAETFESADQLMLWMATSEGWNFLVLVQLLVCPFDQIIQVPCELLDSVEWMSSVSAVGVLLCPPRRAPIPLATFAFTSYMHSTEMIENAKDTRCLAKSLDLIYFLAAVLFAEWKMVMLSAEAPDIPPATKESYTSIDMYACITEISVRMMTKLSKKPPPKLCQHLTSFVQLIANLLFYAENSFELATNIDGRSISATWGGVHLLELFEFCDLIMSSATSPKDIAEMCSVKRVRVLCSLVAARFMCSTLFVIDCSRLVTFVTYLFAMLCSASPPVFLKDLMRRRVNVPFWALIFSVKVAHSEFGSHLVAIVVRAADAKLRREWAAQYPDHLRNIVVKYLLAFNESENSLKDGLNRLLAINGIFRSRAIVPFRSIMDIADAKSGKRGLALKQLLLKILSPKSQNFLETATAKNHDELRKIRTVGSLVVGIFLASLVRELKGDAAFESIIANERAGRKALIADMKRQLQSFGQD